MNKFERPRFTAPNGLIYGAIALVSLTVGVALMVQGGYGLIGAGLPALLTFAGLVVVKQMAQRAALADGLSADVQRLESELSDLGPGGRALEQASEDLAIAAHTLRGVDVPDLTASLLPESLAPPPGPGRSAPTRASRTSLTRGSAAAAGASSETSTTQAGSAQAGAIAELASDLGEAPAANFGRRAQERSAPAATPPAMSAAAAETDWSDMQASDDLARRMAAEMDRADAEPVALPPALPRSARPGVPPHSAASARPAPAKVAGAVAAPEHVSAAASMAATLASSGPNHRAADLARRTPPQPVLPQSRRVPAQPAAAELTHASLAPGETARADQQLADLLRRAAVDGDIEIQLQPIVALVDRKARFYDVFPRLKKPDGGRVQPAEYWAAAHQLGLALVLERQVVQRSALILRKLSERGRVRGFLCRLSQSALADRGLIAGISAALKPEAEIAENMIIELSARDYFRFTGAERDGMAELARHGVRFALEGTETLVVDRHRLATDRVHFLKIGPQALAAEHRVAGFSGMTGLISELRRSGIDVILDSITDEGIAVLGLDCGIILGQGSLYAEPRALAPEFLGETEQRGRSVA